jgi:tetratricopeptide (TPR) repeat protein
MAETKDEPIVDLQETVSKAERYIEENKKSLGIIFGAIVLIVAGYYGWKKFYIEPLETEAQTQMFMAESYFEKDSLNKAVNGDGQYPGFEELVDKYGSTPSGNLCRYYLGISYLNMGRYDDAIAQLDDFDAKDEYLGPVATSAIGDCYMEKGSTDDAIKYYIKAADMNKNEFTSPVILMKAGRAYESVNNFAEAVKIYEQIKSDYPDSREGKEIDKYISYAKSKAGLQ